MNLIDADALLEQIAAYIETAREVIEEKDGSDRDLYQHVLNGYELAYRLVSEAPEVSLREEIDARGGYGLTVNQRTEVVKLIIGELEEHVEGFHS